MLGANRINTYCRIILVDAVVGNQGSALLRKREEGMPYDL